MTAHIQQVLSGKETEMSEAIKNPNLENVTENLLTLANMFRDDGKYVIASALYGRAITFLGGIEASEAREVLLARILDDQSCLDRKMSCGHPVCQHR
jgi:hypothetical protein